MNVITMQVQNRGVITIPKVLRDIWNLKSGDFLNLKIEKNKAVLQPVVTIDSDILEASQKALQELRAEKTFGKFSSMDKVEKILEDIVQN